MDSNDALTKQKIEQSMGDIRLALSRSDVNAKDSFGTTALQLAVNYGQLSVVRLLIESGANINDSNTTGSNALHATTSLKSDDKQAIIDLLLEHGMDINSVDHYGQSSLHLEARWGDEQSLGYLIDKGADINIKDKFGATALHYAAFAEHIEQVRRLLLAGADVHAVDDEGKSVLRWAKANQEIVNLIEDRKLILAIKNNSPIGEIEESLKMGGSPNASDDEMNSLLHLALNYSEPIDLTTLLFSYGAIADSYDKEGRSPLHLAAATNHMALATLLLAKGARINSRDKANLTPLQHAQELGYEEMVLFLRRKGGKGVINEDEKSHEKESIVAIEPINLNGRSDLHNAIEESHSQIIQLLKSFGA